MKETGGTIEDYSRLNFDYSEVDGISKLKEYYKREKPHLDASEIDFLIEDSFAFDEEFDEERAVKKKKLALKEEVAKADKYLGGLKDEYYKEVKLGSKLTTDQQEAVSFYNKYGEEQKGKEELSTKQKTHFSTETNKVFNDDFKGFDFEVGEKKFRYGVKNVEAVKDYQSDISNFVKEFLDEGNMLKDAAGYHKALFAAKNVDSIARHFYEQGKADTIKQSAMKSKNIDMGSRENHSETTAGGIKVKHVGGDDSSKLRIKMSRKK